MNPLHLAKLLLLSTSVLGYIPAIQINAGDAGSNLNDESTIYMTWSPGGAYSTRISYQHAAPNSRGLSEGALIHVQEEDLNNEDSTSTPWIALISCDQNATNTSLEKDIFTMVRERGAVAALLYSNVSDGCALNPFYVSENYNQIFDIFSAKKASSAFLIQVQLTNIAPEYRTFDANKLNSSHDQVIDALTHPNNTSPYLVATLQAANASTTDVNNPFPVPTTSSASGLRTLLGDFGGIGWFTIFMTIALSLHGGSLVVG